MPSAKIYVYVLKTHDEPTAYYTGLTSDIGERLTLHNAGKCCHTSRRRWKVDLVIEFTDEERAIKFERYLKSGSGVAFAKRHLR